MKAAPKPSRAHQYYSPPKNPTAVLPATTPQWADAPRSLVQTINGVYTYAPAYYTIATYVWFPPSPATGTYTVTVGGQVAFVVERTLSVQSVIGRRSTASFTVHAQSAAATMQFVPRIFGGTLLFAQAQAALTHYQQFQQVQVQDGNGVLVNSGFITTPQEEKPGFPNALDTQIVCMDQHFLADKRVVATLYRNQTCGYIVNDMLNTILSQEGVTVGQIAAGPDLAGPNLCFCFVFLAPECAGGP